MFGPSRSARVEKLKPWRRARRRVGIIDIRSPAKYGEKMMPLSRQNEADAVAVEDDLVQYRAVSGLAIAGLLLGLLTPLALIHPLLCLLALFAAIVNLLALRQIAEASPAPVGKRAAHIGLALSLIFGISTPIELTLHRRALRAESSEIAAEWFNALRENRPELAHHLRQYPTTSASRTQSSLQRYTSNPKSVDALRNFVQETPVVLLLKLGKRAHVRWYQNEDVWADGDFEGVRDIYVVTVGNGPQAVSFFIRLGATRSQDLATADWQWQVTKSEFISTPSPALLDTLGG